MLPSFLFAKAIGYLTFDTMVYLDDAISNGVSLFNASIPEARTSPKLATSIPIIHEDVSTTKHQYHLKEHVVLWLGVDHDEPYILTPTPTIKHKKLGKEPVTIERGPYFNIPTNVDKYDIVAIRRGLNCDQVETVLDVTITRFNRG